MNVFQEIIDQWQTDRKRAGATSWFETIVRFSGNDNEPEIVFVAKSYCNWIQRAELTVGNQVVCFGFHGGTMKETIGYLKTTIEKHFDGLPIVN